MRRLAWPTAARPVRRFSILRGPFYELVGDEVRRGAARRGGRDRRTVPQTHPRGVEPDHAGHRRDHRRGHLRADRARRRPARGTRRAPLVRRGRDRLRARRPLLRRDGQRGARRGERLHLLLCHDGRVRRLDHRLGPGPRVRHGGRHRRGRLVRLLREHARLLRDPHPGRAHLGAAPLLHRARRGQRRGRLCRIRAGTRPARWSTCRRC